MVFTMQLKATLTTLYCTTTHCTTTNNVSVHLCFFACCCLFCFPRRQLLLHTVSLRKLALNNPFCFIEWCMVMFRGHLLKARSEASENKEFSTATPMALLQQKYEWLLSVVTGSTSTTTIILHADKKLNFYFLK
jgi:hypothetical protein